MLYSYEITVDASTAETSPSITKKPVRAGVITRVSFRPRPGHAGLLHCRVFYHDLQICPEDRDEDLHGDTFPIEWNDYIELETPPYELQIVAWNDDDTYSHTFDISFAILPPESLVPYSITRLFSQLLAMLNPRRLLGGGL